jgi:hypothetical protein
MRFFFTAFLALAISTGMTSLRSNSCGLHVTSFLAVVAVPLEISYVKKKAADLTDKKAAKKISYVEATDLTDEEAANKVRLEDAMVLGRLHS